MLRSRYFALDALRGLAAIFIMFRHISLGDGANPPYASFLAVDFFFLLSGFVLEPTFLPKGGAAGYMVKRAIRLWPAYLVGLFLAFAAVMFSSTSGADRHAALLALIPGLVLLPIAQNGGAFLLGPAWSLFAEFWVANLAFALFYRRLGVRGLCAVLVLAGGLLILLGLRNGSLDFGVKWDTILWSVPRVLFSFSLGCICRRFAPTSPPKLGVAAFAAITVVFLALLALPRFIASAPVQLLVVGIGFPMILTFGSWVQTGPGLRLACEVLGDLSYPVYTLHAGLALVLRLAWKHGLFPTFHPTLVAAAVIALLSWLFAVFFDAPVRRWLTARLLDYRPQPR